jgi:cephalosporin hydroxylase
MEEYNMFKAECVGWISEQSKDVELIKSSKDFFNRSFRFKYSYNFEHLGRPIIQYPQDIVAIQELIWRIKPDLVIETGIAHGGSLVLSASMLAIIDLCEAIEAGVSIDPSKSKRKVLGIESHPMASRIEMIQGSSIESGVIEHVRKIAASYNKIMVLLDSNHTHDHVLAELHAYAPLVSIGSYCVVFDTFVEDVPDDTFPDRPWGPGNNPKTAVHEFMKNNNIFQIDRFMDSRLLISVAPDGYLKRIF